MQTTEKIRLQHKEYYKNNKEKFKLYAIINRDRINKRARERRKKNKNKAYSIHKKWIENNKARYIAGKQKPERRYTAAIIKAKARGLDFILDKDFYIRLIQQPCSYCGVLNLQTQGVGLDRIDNSKGYILGNVLPCCGTCNKIRGCYLTVEEMKVAMKAITEYRLQNI